MQDFVRKNETTDVQKLILKRLSIGDVSPKLLAQQIEGRKRTKDKLPTFYGTRGIIYPPGVNLEQTSSETSAAFKGKLLAGLCESTNHLIDLTGGFGVDSFLFSKYFAVVEHVEPNANLSMIAQHNHRLLGALNIQHHQCFAEEFLHLKSQGSDVIFIDPSRRNVSNQKVFLLSETVPDVVSLLHVMLSKAEYVLIKTSPLLDLHQAIKDLSHIQSCIVISINNDCKELLIVCNREYRGEAEIQTFNFAKENEEFSFTFSDEAHAITAFATGIEKFVYEPNASILKAGAFKSIGTRFHLKKLHQHTHYYTSDMLIRDFPGRIFEVEHALKASVDVAHSAFPSKKANVITRNYPLTPEELKNKLKLSDGGDDYLIGATTNSGKVLLKAKRIK